MRFLLTIAATAALAAVPACTSDGAEIVPETRVPEDGRLVGPDPVTDHVWYMHQPLRTWSAVIGNVGIIEQSDGVVLVDSGGSIPDGRDVVAAVRKLTDKPVKAVVVTHWHNDHPLGLPGILEAYPKARVIATARTAELMRDPTVLGVGVGAPDREKQAKYAANSTERSNDDLASSRDAKLSAAARAEYATESKWLLARAKRQAGNFVVVPTETFTDVLRLPDSVAPIEVRYLGRANTKGDAFVWLPRQRVVMTGDAVVLPTPYGFGTAIAPWIETLTKLQALDFAFLVPGHGPVQRDRTYLETLLWSMRDIESQADRIATKAGDAESAWRQFDSTEQRRRFKVRNEWEDRWLTDYWLNGMFEGAFKRAKNIPIEVGTDAGD